MKQSRHVILVTLAWLAAAGAACTQKAADEALDATREGTATAIEETKEAGQQVVDATGDAAERAVDKTKEIASEIASTTGEAITDTWITTRVRAKFLDEIELEGSSVSVDTDNRVVTLTGTVGSAAAKSRAEAIASGTEGVARVVNQLVVS